MQTIQEQISFASTHGLFRTATAHQLFITLLTSWSSLYPKLQKASHVDTFISHSWSCPRWLKFLAICHHLNYHFAIACSGMAAFLAVMTLALIADGFSGIVALPRRFVYVSCVCWPIVAFLLAYLFGHLRGSTSFWFDQVCVNQEDSVVKVQTLQAIPAFIAKSTQLLLLWDDSLFERLWCNYELAVHAKTSKAGAFKIVPMWQPMWTLTWLGSWSGVSFLYFIAFFDTELPEFDASSQASLFMSVWNMCFLPPVTFLVPSIPFSWFCFQKLEQHKSMLDQMSHFDIRNAKCTLESDRRIIMEQVLSLFDEALEPPLSVTFDASEVSGIPIYMKDEEGSIPLISRDAIAEIREITSYPTHDEIIDQFNAFVRGPLLEGIVRSMGKEYHISFSLCIIASLPIFLMGLAEVLGCDGQGGCQKSADKFGYPSVFHYVFANSIMDLLLVPLPVLVSIPLLLLTNHFVASRVQGGVWRMIVGSLLCSFVLSVCYFINIAETAVFIVVVAKFDYMWFCGFAVGLMSIVSALWFLYIQNPSPDSQRSVVRM